MMYRQILIRPEDTHLQRIVWSPSAEQVEKHFVLLTVTYGVTSAPYLALRTLQQLCQDEDEPFPEAVNSVKNELYIDDCLSGGHNVDDARHRRDQLKTLLSKGGFELKKWVSNHPDLVADIPVSDRLRPSWRHFEVGGLVNELGLSWDPVHDQFQFSPPKLGQNRDITKRSALSELARLFDPLGWLAPLIVLGKMHIQDLWRAKLSWDEPNHLPRWIECDPDSRLELHLFVDASRRALAATVYSRPSSSGNRISTHLIAAKTKLTPVKSLLPTDQPVKRMTIPRLELRAALLGAKLLRTQAEALGLTLSDCTVWSDSQVVIHWLSSKQPVGNDLVDNYINHIQELLPDFTWQPKQRPQSLISSPPSRSS